jgi:hypothetical protein
MARPRKDAQEGNMDSPQKFKTVKCISERRPWVTPVGEKEARPLKLGDVVEVDLAQAKHMVALGFVTLWDEDME